METKKATVWSRNFICVMAANTMLCLAHFAVNPLVASYALYLGAGTRLMGFLTGMFFGVALAMRPISGPLITKTDKRRLIVAVYALGAAANLGYALFQTVSLFVAFRFLNGVQYSFVGSLLLTLAGDNLPPERMASGMGIYGIGGAVGTAFAPAVGTWLVGLGGARGGGEGAGYRLLFLCAAGIMLAAIVPSALLSPDTTAKGDAETGRWYANIFSVHAAPTAAVMLFMTMAYSLYSAFIIEFAKERGIGGISAFFTVLALTLVVSRPLSGTLTDRLGVKKVLFPALLLFGASFAVVSASRTLGAAVAGAVLAAVGYGAAQPTIQAMCLQTMPAPRRGVASNTLYVGMDLGLFLGPLFGGFACDRFDFAWMYRAAVAPVAAGILCLAVVLPGYYKRLKSLRE